MSSSAAPHTAFVTAPMRGPGLDKLTQLARVVYEPWTDQEPLRIYDDPGLAKRLLDEDADILVVEADLVGPNVFERPLIAVAATRGDPNNVDVNAATAAGVPVVRTPGRNADAVAELAIGLLMALARRLLPADRDVREVEVFRDGTIPYQRFRGWEVAGRRAAIVGYGAVGRALEWRLRGLGMTVAVYDPYVEGAGRDLESAVRDADVVSVHAALTAESAGLFGEEQFSWMQPGAVFLNTARAQLHDMAALVAALESGHLGGAGLDHFDGEMLPAGHPLLSMANVVLTPHIGGATTDTEARGAQMVADDLERILAGELPLYLVNPEVLARQIGKRQIAGRQIAGRQIAGRQIAGPQIGRRQP
jgi:D-3-phosphoglycerate dehydrogenase / 2-oxoglutarate reductase